MKKNRSVRKKQYKISTDKWNG